MSKKVKCKPRSRQRPLPESYLATTKLWSTTLPFNVNPRGALVHRVRAGATHMTPGYPSHDSLEYWCDGCVNGEGVDLVAVPPKNRLLCARCERNAVDAGEPPASKIAGRHVHIGVMKPVRLCCRNEQN